MSKLKPLNGYLIIKPVETGEETYGNIVIPDLGKERPEMGEVLATSKTYNYHSDRWIESQLIVGQTVLIPKLGAARITVEGEEYFICKEQDVYSVFGDTKSGIVEAFKETKAEPLDENHYFLADINKINELNQEPKP